MTRLTALIIQTRGSDVHCEAAQDPISKRWMGIISLYKNGQLDHWLLSTEPQFHTEAEAVNDMQKIVQQVREIDLQVILKLPAQPTA